MKIVVILINISKNINKTYLITDNLINKDFTFPSLEQYFAIGYITKILIKIVIKFSIKNASPKFREELDEAKTKLGNNDNNTIPIFLFMIFPQF